jgi:hypothetical protein
MQSGRKYLMGGHSYLSFPEKNIYLIKIKGQKSLGFGKLAYLCGINSIYNDMTIIK